MLQQAKEPTDAIRSDRTPYLLHIVHVCTPNATLLLLHAPSLQKLGNLGGVVALDDDVRGQTVDLDILVLLVQEYAQLVPQR